MSVNQANQMNQVNQINKQKLIWSSIRNKLNISLHQENLLAFLRAQEVQTILQKFLTFYTEGNKNEILPNDLKFLSKYKITPLMQEFIGNIADCLNMTRMRSFELLDSYFSLHVEDCEKILNLLDLKLNYQEQSSQTYFHILVDLENKKSKIIEFYFKERKNLILFFLDIFFQIFLEIENTPINLLNFMDNFIKSKKMLEVFYKQLKDYNLIRNIFDRNRLNNRYVKEILEKIPMYLCEEQNLILELIMILVHQGKYNDPKIFEGLFNYFISTQFYCQSQILIPQENNLKYEIMVKCLLITICSFQSDIVCQILEGKINLLNNIMLFNKDFNFNIALQIYNQPINNHVLIPIKLTLKCLSDLLKKHRGSIENSAQKIQFWENTNNKDFQERESFGFLNFIDEKIQSFEGYNTIDKGLTIYDIYYDILYDWIDMIMGLFYQENIDLYEPLMFQLLFRIMAHFLPQRKFYTNLFQHKKNNITNLFEIIKKSDDKKDIFLNFCFALSKSIEPGEDNEKYLLNILSIEPIQDLKKILDDNDDDINKKKEIILQKEKDIFFYDIFNQWNELIQELFDYSQSQINQINVSQMNNNNVPEELVNKINYIRLFIRAILPSDSFSIFIFNYTYYINLKEKLDINDINNNLDEDDINYGIQAYNPEIFKKIIFSSVTVLSLITELQVQNKNILFSEFITELLKLFILYTQDNHFVECLKQMNYFFEKFNGKNIIFNIIENDNLTQNFNNTLYAVKFIKNMFKPEIFLQVARNVEFNNQNKLGEIFYVSNFYYIKELINHFTQINEYLTPENALLVSELNETLIQIMNYLEFKNNYCKIDVIEVDNNFYDNKNLANFVIKLLMQDNKEYVVDNNMNQYGSNNLLLIDFIFKYLGIKINDDLVRNFNINDLKKKLFFNNLYVQQYLSKNRFRKENYNQNNNYNISCYKKMILSSLNCLSKILSLIIILNKKDQSQESNIDDISTINPNILKYSNINFINKLNYTLISAKEIPHYIYESLDEKRKYNLNIILLLFFYSLYEIEINELLNIERKNIINLEEEQPTDLEFFMADIKSDYHLNVSTSALNNLCKIIYIVKDTGININNLFMLEKISSSEINSNINLFKLIRHKLINILGSKNHDIDLLKIEILKLLIISTKYQFSFVKNFIQGSDNIDFNNEFFTNLSTSLKFINNNEENIEQDYNIKIESKSLRAELYTYELTFISELLDTTHDIKILGNILIKDSGITLINSLINYGIHSCDISKNCDVFNKIIHQNLKSQNVNISDIFFISNSLKLVIDIFSLKLNIIRFLSILFKRILLFSKETKKLKIKFNYAKELKYFMQMHIKNVVEFYAKTNEYNLIQTFMKSMQKEMINKGIQLKFNYLSDEENMNKKNSEMILMDYIFNYDYNYSFDIKEFIVKGFYDEIFKEKYLKNVIINNCYCCYYYLLVQSFTQVAHLYGLIFSLGELNYLLTDKLFSNVEIYKIFKDCGNNTKLINSYNEEINSILNFDNCYNYKLLFNPLKDLFENDENIAINFIKKNIIDKSTAIDLIPNLTLNEHRIYYQMLNCSLDYIIYLHNKSVFNNQNRITSTIDFYEFLKKLITVLNEGINNNNITDNNLLSCFNLIYHIIYYLILTEKNFEKNDDNDNIENNIMINNEFDNDDKIQVILEIIDSLIIIFKKIKDCRSIILYIFSCIVYINNNSIKKSIKELFDIILKVYTKENDSFEFHSFLLLLNRLKINYPYSLMEIMKNPNIFNFIYMKCGYNSNINLYSEQMHTSGHLIYIWTLKVLNNILSTYLNKISNEQKPNYNNVISNIIKFIELIQQRFKDLFNICINNNNFIPDLSQNNYITLAFLDELSASVELITSFISIECDNSCPVTKDESFLEFLFDSVDMISNTCLSLYKNGYHNIDSICKPNSRVENLMLNTKINLNDLSEGNINNFRNRNNNINISSNNFISNQLNDIDNDNDNIYKAMFNNEINNNNNNENNIDIEYLPSNDKSANVFHYKIKTNLVIILFNISSSMIQLLNRQNFNLKKYFFNKYQLKENEAQLKSWPMLYLSSIKFCTDFLKDIFTNLKKYQILYNKSIILLNSINISLGNCFINEVQPEYPLNELIDLMLFILNDFCEININYNEFIELIIKNHPYINNSRAALGDIYQLSRGVNNEIARYGKNFDEDGNFMDELDELKKRVGNTYKMLSYKY